ncbi:unnamed protein product [Linum trigynum]|uniref:NAF domain-containing protein n=1 Tax=Linum trigynum TaxID=586398 RepID=A0AAV2CX16_9ROSI
MKKSPDAEEEEKPRPLVFLIPKNPKKEEEEEGEEEGIVNSASIPSATKISSPKIFNAFQFIPSMSSGFDLSSLFESTRRRRGSMFTSRCSVVAIMERMEGFAKGINFRVGRVKDFKMSLKRGT